MEALREVMDERFHALIQVVDSRSNEQAKATEALREIMDERAKALNFKSTLLLWFIGALIAIGMFTPLLPWID